VRREKGVTQGECNECEERETEIIVEITYELHAEETRGNKIERRRRRRRRRVRRRKLGEGEAAQLFPRDFLIIYRARVFLSFVARE